MSTGTKRFDAAEHLLDNQDLVHFLQDGLETDTAEDMLRALDTVIRAKGLAALAEQIGLSRTALDDILNPFGSPKRDDLIKIYSALGVLQATTSDAAE